MNRHDLFLSTAVAPIGSGRGGGVERAIQTLAKGFASQGRNVRILAPAGSRLSEELTRWNHSNGERIELVCVEGELQIPAQLQPDAAARQSEHQLRNSYTLSGSGHPMSALEGMLSVAFQQQDEARLILNFGYDRLPLRLTDRFSTPLYHLISMGSMDPAFDRDLFHTERQTPGRLACHTQIQASSFPDPVANALRIIGLGLDLDHYDASLNPGNELLWMGRISPEKGVHEAIEAAEMAGVPLRLAGPVDDPDYWKRLCERWPDLPGQWLGYLSTRDLQIAVGRARALLMTPKWIEAFGIVAIESLACGTPVLAYKRGGPAEILKDGETGILVQPDRPDELAAAIGRIDTLSRAACRADARNRWSMQAWTERCLQWVEPTTESP